MPRTISGLLIDIEGVLVSGKTRLSGSLETLDFLNKKRVPFLLVTNTTRMSRVTIWHHLIRLGFPITENHILTPSLAATNWLKKQGVEKIALLLSGSAANDFKQFKITAANPQYLVIGDLAQDLTFEKLNHAFRLLMRGAKILALQKNRYWQTNDGFTIDAGAIVAALEFASKKRALIIGKPQKNYFLEAADIIGIPINKLAMIGDDLEIDIKGGQSAGLFSIAVKTGNFREDIYKKGKIKPGVVLNKIDDLPVYLNKHWGEKK
jgi:HAD superfamily hydrolase (TIGR01458 family)